MQSVFVLFVFLFIAKMNFAFVCSFVRKDRRMDGLSFVRWVGRSAGRLDVHLLFFLSLSVCVSVTLVFSVLTVNLYFREELTASIWCSFLFFILFLFLSLKLIDILECAPTI